MPTIRMPSSGWLIAAALALTCFVYTPGLRGSWFFDDYPNIVNNPALQPVRLGWTELVRATLSSPASDLKRPLASLSFVANFAVGGLDPFGWKLVNLILHLANGWLVFLLARLLRSGDRRCPVPPRQADIEAAVVAAAWLLLPINLTPVLLVVQRMESLANVFVLLGLIGYMHGRRRMNAGMRRGLALCITSLSAATLIGLTAKETAVMLPLYAFLIEAVLFRFCVADQKHRDGRLVALFGALLLLPATSALFRLTPWLLSSSTWAARDFNLGTRLLTEARVVVDYVVWTFLPTPPWLSFYHDDIQVSKGLFDPWTTAASVAAIAAMFSLAWLLRRRWPPVSLGLGLFLGCHLLTGTVLPLELAYEHRNYFASFGLLLAAVPLLGAPAGPMRAVRRTALGMALMAWAALTLQTAIAWGDPLRLAQELAVRAPHSPRAQFGYGQELLRHGGPLDSPMSERAFAVLEQAGSMPRSSILPEQTLILASLLNEHPTEARWWQRLNSKLRADPPNGEDIDALGALTHCAHDGRCKLPADEMEQAFAAAESHAPDNARLLTIHGDYAWNVLGDSSHGEMLTRAAVQANPSDADVRITLARMNLVRGDLGKVQEQLRALETMNRAGQLDGDIAELKRLLALRQPEDAGAR